MALVSTDLLLELSNLLSRIRKRIRLAIEGFHAMTTDTATLIKQVLRQIQSIRALRHPIIRMTHLAAGLGILLVKERMQPEGTQTVGLDRTGRRATITAMTGW